MINKSSLTLILIVFIGLWTFAGASYFYAYDENGNRTSVSYVSNCRKKAPTEDLKTVTATKVYPTLANDHFNISFATPIANVSLKVYDVTGKLVIYEPNLSSTHIIVDIQELSAGTYIVALTQNQEQILIEKIIKQ